MMSVNFTYYCLLMQTMLPIGAADEVEDDFLDSREGAEGNLQEVQAEVHTQPSRPRRVLPEDAAAEDEPLSGTAELAN